LKEKGSSLGDTTQSAADIFNYDPADLDEDYADAEDQHPGSQMHKNEIREARLRGFTAVSKWKDLVLPQGN
jgi:hypothetical protein